MISRTSTINPTDMLTSAFYNEAKYVGKGGYYKGNKNYQCVNFAVAETTRIANKAVCYYSGISTKKQIEKPMFNRSGYGNAVNWLKDTLWEKGTTPKLGAVMVYGSAYGNGYGHVRIVEKIDGDKLFIAGANENKQMAFKWIDKPQITATSFLGYIYNPYVKEDEVENMSLIKIEKNKNYEYKWSVDGNKYGDDYDITTEKGFGDTELAKDGWELVLKVNGSLFYNYGDDYFACGLEKSRGVNNQDVGMSCVKNYNSCMSIASYQEDLYFASQEWVINNLLDSCYGAITGMGLLLSGSKRNDMHKGFESQWNTRSGRTVIGEDKDGNFLSYSFAGETGKSGMTCAELQDKCLELGFVSAVCLDGGGSVFRWYDGKYDISTTRKVKNALLLYRRKKQVEEKPSNQENQNKPIEEVKNDFEEKYNKINAEYEIIKEDYNELSEQYNSVCELHEKGQEEIKKLNKVIENLTKEKVDARDKLYNLYISLNEVIDELSK